MDKLEEELNRQTSLDSVRNAMVKAGQEHRELLSMANEKMYLLYRLHYEQSVNRMVTTSIMVSKDKQKLIEFARTYFNCPSAFLECNERYNISDDSHTSIHIKEIGII